MDATMRLKLGLIVGCLTGLGCDPSEDAAGDTDAGSEEGMPDSRVEAKAFFWGAFAGQRHGEGEEATRLLEEANAEFPNDPETTLLLGHVHLWRLAELARAPSPDPSQVPNLAANAARYFGEAMAVSPADARIFGWLGPLMMSNGQILGDPAMVEAGQAMIETGVERYPEFNSFVLALSLSNEPRESDEFARAIDAMWQNIDVCAGQPVNRDVPDFSGLVDTVVAGAADDACRDSPRAAHNFEGFFLFFGDLLTKAGSVELAQAAYATALQIPEASRWPYRDVLIERQAAVQDRAERWANDDPADDPLLVSMESYSCSYCHADG